MDRTTSILHSQLLRLLNWFIHTINFSYFLKFFHWMRYYICFCKAAAFVSGLVFSHKLVDFAVLNIFITYFSDNSRESDNSGEYNIKKAAVLTSIQEGLSATFVIVATWNSYKSPTRPIKIMICSTASYTGALWLLYLKESGKLSGPNDLLNIIAMILLAMGEAGVKPLLGAFLANQLRAHKQREINNDQDEDKIMAQKMVWWRLAWCGSVVSAFLLYSLSWSSAFKWTGVAMGSSFILFLLGIRSYRRIESTVDVSPFIIFRVVKASIKKRHLIYPSSADQFYCNADGNQLYIPPRLKFLRWLDKAAIIESSTTLNPQQEENVGRLCTATQVRQSKLLLKMFPMWTSFLVFGLVQSAGNTFFPEQATNMRSEEFMTILLIFKPILGKTISYLSNLLILKWVPKINRRQAQIVRILIGMVISTFCFTIAWRVEVHRLIVVHKKGLLDKPKASIPMNMFWLVPQFCMLGLMEGLAESGLDEYVSDHFPKWIDDHTSAINGFVIGLGSFLNILFVLANKSLFDSSLNRSRLDKYYMRLTILSFVNMCYNGYLSTGYIQSEKAKVDERLQTTKADTT